MAAERNRKLTSSITYVIDRYKLSRGDFNSIMLICKLIKYCTRDILQYLIAKIFGEEISAELKAEIFLFLALKFQGINDLKTRVVQFCTTMGWKRSDMHYIEEPNQFKDPLFGKAYQNAACIKEFFSLITDY